ncbi:MAG TPA: ABC transporter permease [Kineosporiaceae bacterium]|nr:ABC transporter permease [Kineosporiaceae bacterium]
MSDLVIPSAATQARVLVGRAVRLSLRTPDALIVALTLPVMLMLLFVYLFGGALDATGHYVEYVVPGVLLLCATFGASTTAVAVCADLTGGVVDRLRSMDVGGPAFLAGHVAASLARNAASTLLVLAVALAIGFRSPAGVLGWLGAAGVLALFVLALSWFAAALGLLARSTDAANGLTFFLAFLPYPSSAFVAVATMPAWLGAFSAHQPVTPVIESIRGLLLGRPVAGDIWTAIAWCTGLLAVSVVLSAVLFARRTAGARS